MSQAPPGCVSTPTGDSASQGGPHGLAPAAAAGSEAKEEDGTSPEGGIVHSTDSVENLQQIAPQWALEEGFKDSWRGYACVHAGRVFQKQISDIKLLPSEYRRLIGENGYGHRGAQYVAWRSSLLSVGAFFYAALVALDVVFCADPWQTGSTTDQLFVLKHISERYHVYFDNLVVSNRVHAILLVVASVFSVAAALHSAWYSSTFRISKNGVRGSFTCSYLPPFLLLLVIPFRHTVDFVGIQKEICSDVLNRTASYAESKRMWPGKSSNFARTFLQTYGLELPSGFCEQDPHTWGDSIAAMLENGGFLEENGTCPRAESQVEDLVKASATVALNAKGLNTTNGSLGATVAANAGTAAAVGVEMLVEASEQASNIIDTMESSTWTNSTCGASCWNCTTTCAPFLSKLAALSSIYDLKIIAAQWAQDLSWDDLAVGASVAGVATSAGTAAVSAGSAAAAAGATVADAAATAAAAGAGAAAAGSSQTISDVKDYARSGARYLSSESERIAAQCTHCFSWEAGLRCAWDCEEVRVALARAAIVGDRAEEARLCVKPSELTSVTLLVELGTQTAYWKMLLGAVYAVASFAQLLPLTFSILFGAAKGSSIAKSVIPYSRLPDVVSAAAAIFTFPFIFVLVVLIQTVVGNWLTLIGVLCLLGGIIASMQPKGLKAVSHEELVHNLKSMSNISLACFFLSVVCFAVSLGLSGLVRSIYRVLQEQGIEISTEDKKNMGSQFTWFVVRMVTVMLGKSLISTVFFSDGVVTLLDVFHWNDDRDPLDVQCARMRLVEDMHTLRQEPEASDEGQCTAVHPEREDAHAAAQEAALHALQALVRLQSTRQSATGAFTQEEEDALTAAKTLPELLQAVMSGPLGKDAKKPAGTSSAPAVIHDQSSSRSAEASANRDSRTVLRWFQRKMAAGRMAAGRAVAPEP